MVFVLRLFRAIKMVEETAGPTTPCVGTKPQSPPLRSSRLDRAACSSRAVVSALGQEMARSMCHFQVRRRSKPHRGFGKKRLLTLFQRICFRICAGALSARARLALDQESAHPNSVAAAKNRRPAKADLRFLVEVTGLAPLAARPRRSKANFAGVRLWQTPRFQRLLLLFPQIFCCAKSLREPCHQPTGLFSLRPSDMFPSNSRANRSLSARASTLKSRRCS